MEKTIDFDRGVVFRNHPSTGMYVYMYTDEPGVYLSAYGRILPDDFAAEAGFPVEQLTKERLRRERVSKATKAINAEMGRVEQEQHKVVFEKNGFKTIDIGLGRHNVLDPEGNVLNGMPLPEDIARRLVEKLVGE